MGTVFIIGGGEIGELKTLPIDKKVVESSGKDNPKLLFIPTASEDAEGYVDTVKTVYGDKLGCEVDALYLVEGNTSSEEAREKILSSDIIYVGGGDTGMMIEVWKKYNVDKHLAEAYEKGVILSGMSAGSNCWFKYGHSDIGNPEKEEWNYILLEGINLIDAYHCPHYNEDKREEDFDNKVFEHDGVGIAVDNNIAVEIRDDKYKVHKSQDDARAYKVYKGENGIVKEKLVNTESYRDVKELFSK